MTRSLIKPELAAAIGFASIVAFILLSPAYERASAITVGARAIYNTCWNRFGFNPLARRGCESTFQQLGPIALSFSCAFSKSPKDICEEVDKLGKEADAQEQVSPLASAPSGNSKPTPSRNGQTDAIDNDVTLTLGNVKRDSVLAPVTFTITNGPHAHNAIWIDCTLLDSDKKPIEVQKGTVYNVAAGKTVYGDVVFASKQGDFQLDRVTCASQTLSTNGSNMRESGMRECPPAI